MVFPDQNSISEHHHQILHIQIRLYAKFHLHGQFWFLWPNIIKKDKKNLVYGN